VQGLPRRSPNYRRRSIGLLACNSPLVLLLASLIYGWIWDRKSDSGVGLALMFLAVSVGALNFYLSFVRPSVYHLRYRSMERYHFISGVPVVGTLLVAAGATLGFGGSITALMGICAMFLDTGSSFWFLLATWGDTSFWDA
jgi:hypothetical protein